MSANGQISAQTLVEQAWARGLIPEEIAIATGVKLHKVLAIGRAMDRAAHGDASHERAPNYRSHPQTCRNGHPRTPENTIVRRGFRDCRDCRRIRETARRQQRRALRARWAA